jgi:hypothetical protein
MQVFNCASGHFDAQALPSSLSRDFVTNQAPLLTPKWDNFSFINGIDKGEIVWW